MTDRVHTLAVVLKEDVREDDIEVLINAIRQFRNVLSVSPIVSNFTSHMAEVRAREQMLCRLVRLIEEVREDG